ncbi:hypothetical protein CPAR01_07627 [Colletotrichum paranaense]|uniref:Tat pathway signal sequence n=1 Tax=Colletotrichum paranaense TaxID=1914294 RepID=A0ABQ9SHX3_9PEZI|nr:uncharacterized protein CPAR01_07627 [Colletotrichum paranaense]KAK1537514.1 hypothetical protein CPAR01_07627 [Colletotrichum paranaense]
MGRNHEEYAPVYSDESLASSREAVEAAVAAANIRHTSKLHRFGVWTLHAVLITIYTAIFAVSLLPNRPFSGVFSLIDGPETHYGTAPPKAVGEKTHLEVFPIQGPPHGKYTGEPRPEVDQAWRDLLQYVQKRLYQTLSPDYYFPNATKQEIATNREHNQHCLEVLRMGAACRGDISIITHMWTDIDAKPIVNQTAPHQCIDFDKVMDYSRDNTVDVYKDNYIVHPKFGPSFPKGNSIKPFKEQGMGHHH